MNKTIFVIALLIVLLAGAWTVLSIGGRQTQPLANAQSPGRAPMSTMMGVSAPQGAASAKLTRSDNGEGNVNISATYITDEVLKEDPSLAKPGYNAQNDIAFFIAMNSHVSDVSSLKMEEIAVLRDAAGNEHRPVGRWLVVAEMMGHHRSGFLRFKRLDSGGKDITKGPGSLTLVIRGVASVRERQIAWKLPLPRAGK